MDTAERERLQLDLVRRFSAAVPHNHALGIKVLEIIPTQALFELPYDEKLVGNPDTGVLHGGVITALLDGVSGAAVFATITEMVPIATLDLRIDYLRPAEVGQTVRAKATCYKTTRNVAFTRAVAYHDAADTHARGIITRQGRRVTNVRIEAWQEDRAKPVATANAIFLVMK